MKYLLVLLLVGCASNTVQVISAKTMPKLLHQANEACPGKGFLQVDTNGSIYPEATYNNGQWQMLLVCNP